VLARFMRKLGSELQTKTTGGATTGWVLLSDTNIGVKPVVTKAFQQSLNSEAGVSWLPENSMVTTSKHRSILHGQCYDTNKCNKTVAAAKDYLVTALPGCLKECRLTPDLALTKEGVVSRTLPAPDWGSDHCLVTAVYVSSGTIKEDFNGILQAFKAADRSNTGLMRPASLKWLFQELDSVVFAAEEFDTLMQKSGTIKSGQVKYEEFLRWLWILEGR